VIQRIDTLWERRYAQASPPAAAAPKQLTSNEPIGLIRKLRWMGMENETKTKTLLEELVRRRAAGKVSVIAPSHEND
jgi:hypothetical protein